MQKKQISPLGKTPFTYVNYEIPFFMATAYIYGKDRRMTPIWPIDQNNTQDSFVLGTNFHYHNYFELIYVLEGTYTQHLENSVYTLNTGDATLLNTHIRHYDGEETRCTCIYINMSPSFLQSLLFNNDISPKHAQHHCVETLHLYEDAISTTPDNRASLDFRRSFRGSMLTDSDLSCNPKAIISEMISVLSQEDPGYAYALQSLLIKLFASLENTEYFHNTLIYTHTNTETVLFSDIQHFVEERNGRISREELAEILHYNPDYLARIVKQQTGMNFLTYSRSIWIEKVKSLLTTTDLTVTEIIESLGFENKNNFYRVFYSSTGMTPIEYRQQFSQIEKSEIVPN